MYDDSLDEKSRQNHRKLFAQDVKKHLDDIHNKYLIPGVTADLAYMFIPAEAIFADLYASFPDLIDYSYKQKVYIVSPTTLMAYITAIKSIYLRHKKDEKAREIENLLNDLSVEFARFQKRSEELYKDYEDLSKAFASLNISANKISKRFDRLNNGEIEPKENGN
jgi:DNA recombination protein RmuC